MKQEAWYKRWGAPVLPGDESDAKRRERRWAGAISSRRALAETTWVLRANLRYFATDAECSPITPITINPREIIFTVVAGSLK